MKGFFVFQKVIAKLLLLSAAGCQHISAHFSRFISFNPSSCWLCFQWFVSPVEVKANTKPNENRGGGSNLTSSKELEYRKPLTIFKKQWAFDPRASRISFENQFVSE